MKFFTPALRFDLGLLERYRHVQADQVIDVPITAICGTDDRAVDLADMQRWETMTSAAFRLRSMPGDHFFPLERMAEILAAATWDTVASGDV
jgi:pyochelin biosynthetic protein PchC